ncbi:hypothetical protein OPV22_009393 [Ensete ventricosum]|uniref:Uncharacterized protein n=1 Tax=Ensete ventricosum TaxID=4639 RepID=A0AAV8R8R8_ENSVE|nr:hypothetical protein OPV22_009393 [Ensete ventricosum]
MAASSRSIINAVKTVGSVAAWEVVSCLFGTYVLWMLGMVVMLLPVMLPNSPHAARMEALVLRNPRAEMDKSDRYLSSHLVCGARDLSAADGVACANIVAPSMERQNPTSASGPFARLLGTDLTLLSLTFPLVGTLVSDQEKKEKRSKL